MILFLFGEDTYRSHQKLAQIKARFIDASLGDTNLSVADCADKELDYTQITRMVLAMPFLAKTRLVIIKNLLSDGKKKLQEQFIEFLPKIPETTVLVIYESEKVDRRTALFKKLNKPPSSASSYAKATDDKKASEGKPQSQEFKLLEPYELKKWIMGEVELLGGLIDNMAVDKLIEYVGNDLWRLSNEIRKLTTYCHSEFISESSEIPNSLEDTRDRQVRDDTIKSKDVELLVRARVTANVFDLIDAIGAKNIKRAQSELHKLLDSGMNELYIHTMVVYQFRNLLIIKDLLDEKTKSEKLKAKSYNLNLKTEILKQSGLHPFVAEKTMGQAKNYTMERLKEIYKTLLDYDVKMKTGQIEPKLALDLMVMDIIGEATPATFR